MSCAEGSCRSVLTFQERLQTHSSAFDGLLSLIPAKYYYDDATQDQWQQQKKLKSELQQHKRAKLDPTSKSDADDYTNSHASAKDVMANRAKVAQRVVLPGRRLGPTPQSHSVSDVSDAGNGSDDSDSGDSHSESASTPESADLIPLESQLIFDDDGNEVEESHTLEQKRGKKAVSPDEQRKKEENLARLRARLSDKINTLKEKRRAPGTKGSAAPKSRDQILAERKKKEELKRLDKLKRKSEQIEESALESEADEAEEEAPEGADADGVLFGNIVFGDGLRVTLDLTKLRATADKRKLKGPANNDIKAHIKKLEAKKERLAALPAEDQAKQRTKDQWQRVMDQAEGIKVKDDEKLLKKALKRKEKQKLKSEIEWRERKQVVKDTVAARAKRREENLKSRRDNKGKKSKHQPKLKKFTGSINKAAAGKKKRAGFEGSAKLNKK